MEWNKINLAVTAPHTLQMELPRSGPMQVNSVNVLICFTTKLGHQQHPTKRYCLGYFDHDGDRWGVVLLGNSHLVFEYLAWAYIEEYTESAPAGRD